MNSRQTSFLLFVDGPSIVRHSQLSNVASSDLGCQCKLASLGPPNIFDTLNDIYTRSQKVVRKWQFSRQLQPEWGGRPLV